MAAQQRNLNDTCESGAESRNYRLLVEKAGSIMLCVNRKGIITFANPYACAFFGYAPEELVGHAVFDTIIMRKKEDHWQVRDFIREILRHPHQHRVVEHENVCKDGKIVSIAWTNELLTDSKAEDAEILAVGIDISSRVKAENERRQILRELEQSRDALAQFVRIAAHDLQEPLRAIAGHIQLLQRRYSNQLDTDADVFINYAVSGVNRLQVLLKDLLAYSYIHNETRAFQNISSEEALRQALYILDAGIKGKKAVITHDALPVIHGDARQITQLFQHLLQNALIFCEQTIPRIHLSVDTCILPADRHFWRFTVSDNGIGVEPQYWEQIFRIFRRLHSTEKFPGTGIGLAICERIVKRHGGEIWLHSQPGQGSTFFFTLPAAVPEKQSQNRQSAPLSGHNDNSDGAHDSAATAEVEQDSKQLKKRD